MGGFFPLTNRNVIGAEENDGRAGKTATPTDWIPVARLH